VSPFVFLGVAMGVAALGFAVLWLRNRHPQSMEARMREFARELDALSPEGGIEVTRRPVSTPRGSPRPASRRNRGRNR